MAIYAAAVTVEKVEDMQKSTYAEAVPAIVSDMQNERERQDEQPLAPDELEQGQQPENKVYVYKVEGGGVYLSQTKITDDETPAIVESQEPETDQRPNTRRQIPLFVHFLLILLIFVALDNVDSVFASLAPTATITIIPKSQIISANTSLALSDIEGRELPALTLSESQTNQATGRGHQDATSATGTLIFYNGSFTPQTMYAGTVYTAESGVQVATLQTVTIPAANPPYVGQATVGAIATSKGANGNIQAGDIRVTTATLQVRNNQFSGGQDARDFTYVTKTDIQQAINTISPRLLQSVQAALTAQLKPNEQLIHPQCSKTITSNHQASDEAASVTVTVSETCIAQAYNQHALQSQATPLLTTQATRRLGRGFTLTGNVQVTIAHSTDTTLVLSIQGVFIYQVNTQEVKQQLYGKPRLTAIQLLSTMPGIARVSVSGIEDNQPLPTDPAHVRILIIILS